MVCINEDSKLKISNIYYLIYIIYIQDYCNSLLNAANLTVMFTVMAANIDLNMTKSIQIFISQSNAYVLEFKHVQYIHRITNVDKISLLKG